MRPYARVRKLTEEEYQELKRWERSRTMGVSKVRRARIVLQSNSRAVGTRNRPEAQSFIIRRSGSGSTALPSWAFQGLKRFHVTGDLTSTKLNMSVLLSRQL